MMRGMAPGQCAGVFRLELQNRTQYFLRVWVAPARGRALPPTVREGGGMVIPPRDSYTVCLDVLGQHSIRGIAFAPNGRQMSQVNRFSVSRTFNARTPNGFGRQSVWIDDYLLNFN